MVNILDIFLAISCVTFNPEEYPMPPKSQQIDKYHGTKVSDPYRTLEDLKSPQMKKWLIAEKTLTDSYLKKIPFRNQMLSKLRELWNYTRTYTPYWVGPYLIYFKNEGLLNQDILMIQEGKDGQPRVLIDPNALASDGSIAITDISPSHDGKYIAYALAKNGLDWMEIYVIETATGRKLKDQIKWVKFSSISWNEDGFFYSRYPAPKEDEKMSTPSLEQKIYFHKLGTLQDQDPCIYDNPKDPYQLYETQTTEDNRFLIVYITKKGTGDNNAIYIKDLKFRDSTFFPLIDNYDSENRIVDIIHDNVYLLTNSKAPTRKLITIHLKTKKEATLIAPSKDVLSYVAYIGGEIFTLYIHDGYHVVKVFSPSGDFLRKVDLPPLGSISEFQGKREGTSFFYSFQTLTTPPKIFEYLIPETKSSIFFETKVPISTDEYQSELRFFKSKDGTFIPALLAYKKDLILDGNRPVLLYGYGGFGASLLPRFNISNFLLLEKNGIYVQALLRGGGEYGEKWHRLGMLSKKQNVFDDFISVAEGLIKENYTNPTELAIKGSSNGGLLVGAVMTQRPDLFAVCFPDVGVFDMLRYHNYTIGWNWIAEYGTTDDRAQFKALYKYSPLHRIRSGISYPATLITTSDHDDRVVPFHSYKFAAALQENTAGQNPILLRIENNAGHGLGKPVNKRVEYEADIWSFLFCNLPNH